MIIILKILGFLQELPKNIALGLILLYQVTLSPDHGLPKGLYPRGFCRFYPSCSDYGYQAIEKFGLFKGGFLTLMRILRCHPWAAPKFDPIPKS